MDFNSEFKLIKNLRTLNQNIPERAVESFSIEIKIMITYLDGTNQMTISRIRRKMKMKCIWKGLQSRIRINHEHYTNEYLKTLWTAPQ